MLYDISEVCRLFGWTPSGVRYFEELGLIHPVRTESGRRKYGEEEMRRLLHIKTLRTYNISLEEIGSFFMNDTAASSEEISGMLEGKIHQMEMQMATLRATQAALQQYTERMRRSGEYAEPVAAVQFPASYALYTNPLFGRGKAEWEGLSRWLALVPQVKRCIHYEIEGQQVISQRDCFVVAQQAAESGALPLLDRARLIPGGQGLRLCRQLRYNPSVHGLEAAELSRLLQLARRQGMGEGLHIFTSYLFGNIENGKRMKLYDIWCIARE